MLTFIYNVFQKRCREIGGYLVKVDNVAENNWISSQKPKSIIIYFLTKHTCSLHLFMLQWSKMCSHLQFGKSTNLKQKLILLIEGSVCGRAHVLFALFYFLNIAGVFKFDSHRLKILTNTNSRYYSTISGHFVEISEIE